MMPEPLVSVVSFVSVTAPSVRAVSVVPIVPARDTLVGLARRIETAGERGQRALRRRSGACPC